MIPGAFIIPQIYLIVKIIPYIPNSLLVSLSSE